MYEILELWENKPCQYDSYEDFKDSGTQYYVQYLYDLCQKHGIDITIEEIEKFIIFLNCRDDEFASLENPEEYRNTAFDVLNKIIKFNEKCHETNYYIMMACFVENEYLAEELFNLECAILVFNYHSRLLSESIRQYGTSRISNINTDDIMSESDRDIVYDAINMLKNETKSLLSNFKNNNFTYFQQKILLELLLNPLLDCFGYGFDLDNTCYEKYTSKVSSLLDSINNRLLMLDYYEDDEIRYEFIDEEINGIQNDMYYTRPFISGSSKLNMSEKPRRKEKPISPLKRTRKDKRSTYRRY